MGNAFCCPIERASGLEEEVEFDTNAARGLPSKDDLRPLLADLEADFQEFCGNDGKLDARELADVWQRCAKRKFGLLYAEDEEMIRQAAGVFLQQIDFDKSGFVSFEELALFMLGGTEDRGPLKGMHEQLKKNKINISDVVAKFRKWDASGDGYLTPEELKVHAEDLQKMCGGKGSPDQLAARLIREADLDNDGKLDLYEILAHTLGRRKQPVELLLYDISGGVSKKYSKLLLGRHFEAIYHSGVYVFDKEFWYGGNLLQSEAPCDKVFGPPLSTSTLGLRRSKYNSNLMVVPLGFTLATFKEFRDFLVDQMKLKYRRENYDVLTHNCNCFSNEVCQFLTGAEIPEQIRNLPALVMQTSTCKMLRPVLNRWLGGFEGGADNSAKDVDDEIKPIEEEDPDAVIKELYGAGSIVSYDGMTAIILSDHGSTADIKFYDPRHVRFEERRGVSKSQLKAEA